MNIVSNRDMDKEFLLQKINHKANWPCGFLLSGSYYDIVHDGRAYSVTSA